MTEYLHTSRNKAIVANKLILFATSDWFQHKFQNSPVPLTIRRFHTGRIPPSTSHLSVPPLPSVVGKLVKAGWEALPLSS